MPKNTAFSKLFSESSKTFSQLATELRVGCDALRQCASKGRWPEQHVDQLAQALSITREKVLATGVRIFTGTFRGKSYRPTPHIIATSRDMVLEAVAATGVKVNEDEFEFYVEAVSLLSIPKRRPKKISGLLVEKMYEVLLNNLVA